MNDKKNREPEAKIYKSCCDIYHDADKVVLRLEMPGVTNKNLDIKVDEDLLIISGKRTEQEYNGKYILREIRTGNYYHEFALDDTIDRTNIDASIKNGVVTLVLGIKESVKPRKIEIKAG